MASTGIRVWYGDMGSSVTLPCGTADTNVNQCTWAVPQDDSGTCSGTVDVTMSSIVAGQHSGLAAAGAERPCDLRVDDLTQGHEGFWICEGSTFQLLVNGGYVPTLFADGMPQSNNSLLSTLNTHTHVLQCSVLWSRPAASIRWVLGYDTDLSADATTASSPSGTGSVGGGCPAVDGDSTWQVSSTLPVSFVVGDQSVSCVVSHKTLSEDLAITIKLAVANRASGRASGNVNIVWCLVASLSLLRLVSPSTSGAAVTANAK